MIEMLVVEPRMLQNGQGRSLRPFPRFTVPGSLSFTLDVYRLICDRLRSKSEDMRMLVESGCGFEEWLVAEAFLACKHRQEAYPFCEVELKPAYASEGIASDGTGSLRVGGPNDGADHCWLFADIVFLRDGVLDAAAEKLLRLGWKKSAALLIVVGLNAEPVDRAALTEPCVIPLAGGGSIVVNAFDIKRNPADTLVTRVPERGDLP